jgi:hypothetical protein
VNGTRVGAGGRERLYASTTATFDDTADLDYIAIEYALNGEPVQLTILEKVYAAKILDERGLKLIAIATRIQSDPSTIKAWKANGWKPGTSQTKAPRAARPEPVCGEARMYRRHLRNGEPPCDLCRAANADADRRYRLTGSRTTA